MLNRRQFVSILAAMSVPARVARARIPAAARDDLVVRGGRVIDPSAGLDAVRDVAIVNGRIAAIARNIAADAAETIDARGRLVVPGLIDIHTHVARADGGAAAVLRDGVTAWIDAGSQGADRIDEVVAIARNAPQLGRVLINIGRAGILPEGDTMDLTRADIDAARAAIARHRDWIVGVKARLSETVAGQHDYEVLRRAQAVAAPFGLPVMVHIGQTASPLSTLLPLLKRGDIVTHMFAPPPNSIVDDAGRVLPGVLDARRRGVWFDVGNGKSGHMRWDTVDTILKAGFWPDTFSTDWGQDSPSTGVVDLPNCMSKLFGYGMTVNEAIARTTSNAARTFSVFTGRGTLRVGATADLSLLELRTGRFEFLDNYGNKITGTTRLFPVGTVLAGRRVEPLRMTVAPVHPATEETSPEA